MIAPADRKALRALLGRKSRAEQRKLIGLIRANDERALLAALEPVKTKKAKPASLTRDVETLFRPLMAPASEKGELLLEALARKHRKSFTATPKGLAAAIRTAQKAGLSDSQIRAGAETLMTRLAETYAMRDTVV